MLLKRYIFAVVVCVMLLSCTCIAYGTSSETYTYDYAGNVTSVKSENANANNWSETHTTEYDFMGNVIKETDELGGITQAEYDALGRMTKAIDQNNYATEYKYDALGRVIEQKTPFEEAGGTVYYSVKKMWYDNCNEGRV